MREYDVETCSEECGKFIASKPSIHHMWTVAVTGKLVATQGDDPSFCPHCNTKFGIDERGPWREAMVSKAALKWALEEWEERQSRECPDDGPHTEDCPAKREREAIIRAVQQLVREKMEATPE